MFRANHIIIIIIIITNGFVVPSDGINPGSILYKSKADRYRPVSYPDGPITARYRFIKNAYWEGCWRYMYILPWPFCSLGIDEY